MTTQTPNDIPVYPVTEVVAVRNEQGEIIGTYTVTKGDSVGGGRACRG